MNLRPYQQTCVDATLDGYREHRRQMIVLPTGGGKTIVMGEICRRLAPHRVLCLAHRDELIQQNAEKIFRVSHRKVGIEKASMEATRNDEVVVASVQTMIRRLGKWRADDFGLVMIDEFHHAASDTYRRIIDHFGEARLLGVTATPSRSDKKSVASLVDNIPYEQNIFDLVEQGFLSPITVHSLPIHIDLSAVRVVAGDYRDDDLDEAITPYFEEIIAAVKEHASGRKVLAFVPLIATSKKLVEVAERFGISACHVDGSSLDRAQILKRYSRGEFQLLSNASLLLEGYDEPSIDCVLMLRPTKSRTLFQQCVGRGTRIHEGKRDLLLFDFLWQTERLGLVTPAHLIAETDDELEAITALSHGAEEPLDLRELQQTAKRAREQALARALQLNQKRSGRLVDARQLGIVLHDAEIYDYEPIVEWHTQPITAKQREMLEGHGIDVSTIRDKGHASKVINVIIKRRNEKLCTIKQMRLLHQNRIDARKMSFEDASAAIAAIIGRKERPVAARTA